MQKYISIQKVYFNVQKNIINIINITQINYIP